MKLLLLTIFSAIVMSSCSINENVQPVDLRCEYAASPLGIDVATPRLMWKIQSADEGFHQTKYRVMVATSAELLADNQGDMWDSGRTESNAAMVYYEGKPLASNTRYFWKVEVWGTNGHRCRESEVAWFETAKLSADEWTADWITDGNDKDFRPAPMFRREFDATKKVAEARVYISGLGYYELFVNGEKIGNRHLDPGFTDFSKRVLYVTYDVTQMVESGQNAVGVILGNGWYNEQTPAVWNFHMAPWRDRPRMVCELHLTYDDGSKELIISDNTWKTATGALLYDNLYVGSTYDARLEQKGWSTVGFDDSAWVAAVPTTCPAPVIQAQAMPPIGASAVIRPESVAKVAPKTYLYNMGKNFAGVCRLKISGPRGTEVVMTHGELLDNKGRLDQSNLNMHLRPTTPDEIIQTDRYILSGDGSEVFMPPFTYHGFQYVEVETSAEIELGIDNLEGVVMHSMVDPIGSFNCSNELINKIYDAAKRSYLSNLYGIPTDCPHREKNGWMADGFMVMESGLLNYDSRNIYAKWVTDMVDAQDASGNVPGIVPTSWNWDSGWAGPIWDASIFLVPYSLYQYYGDTEPIKTIYPAAKKYLAYLETRRESTGLINHGLGDWLFYKAYTPVDFMTTCYYYYDNIMMAEMARITGNDADIQPCLDKAEELKKLINETFFDADSVHYANKTQLSYALPLYVGIVPEEYKEQLAANLNQAIAENDYSLDFGFIGSKVVPIVLSDYGYNETMYKMLTKTTLPSWGYWIEERGATSLYETWDFQRNIGDASLNHPSMGSVNAWMIKSLAGINLDPAEPAFSHIIIKPAFVGDLTFVNASYDSNRGVIASSWRREGDKIMLEVTIPANSWATVELPTADVNALSVKGKSDTITKHADRDNGSAFNIGSGTYRFEILADKVADL